VAGLERAGRTRLPASATPAARRPEAQAAKAQAAKARQAAQATEAVTALISSYGPLGVFLLMVPESACIPIPSEVTLLSSGLAVSQHWMSLPLAIIAATAGNLVGSLVAYALGATRLLSSAPGVRRSAALLDRHGRKAIFIARLLPLARTFVSLPAGTRRTPLLPFIALTTLGCALWALAFVLLGMVTGTASSSLIGKVTLAGGALVIAVVFIAKPVRRRRQGATSPRRLEDGSPQNDPR
jgi:membrane protein DedA with SNARE-associated domain